MLILKSFIFIASVLSGLSNHSDVRCISFLLNFWDLFNGGVTGVTAKNYWTDYGSFIKITFKQLHHKKYTQL